MLTEGWIGNTLGWVGNTAADFGGAVAKGTVNMVGPPAKSIGKGIGTGVYNLANTKLGGTALAAGTGLYLANRIAKKRREKEEEMEQPNDNIPRQNQVKKAAWQKRGRKTFESTIVLEMNENLPGLPGVPSYIRPSPRSIGSYLLGKANKYRQRAEIDHVDLQRKIAAANMKKTQATTGYDKTLGKISAV